MYNGNDTYRRKMLLVINDSSPKLFSMSSASKISKKTNRAFSLPAGPDFACPGATEACTDCYAQKGRHFFNNVQKAFARNWNTFLAFEAAKDEVGCAQELNSHMPKNGIFRIHESGDFHSQFALNVWALVVSSNPNVDFYTYTRSFELNFEPLLSNTNFVLWASTDPFNQSRALEFVKENEEHNVRHAHGPWEHGKELPENSFACPVTTKRLDVLGACEKCQLCVMPGRTKKNVVFFSH